MSISTTVNYDTAGNFTFDSDKVEFSGSVARLKSMKPADSTFFASFVDDKDGSWGGGNLTGTLNGSAAVSGSRLNLTTGSDWIDFSAVDNADAAQIIAIRFLWTPQYTGTPATTQNLFEISKEAGNSNNQIQLSQATNGLLNYSIKDNTGSVISSGNFGLWPTVAGEEVEVEMNVDVTAGNIMLFTDGFITGGLKTGTGTRTTANIGLLRLGGNSAGQGSDDSSFRYLQVFNTIQHTSQYTPTGIQIESEFATDGPTVVLNSSLEADGLVSLTEVSTVPTNSSTRWLINVNASPKYWDGAAWVTSDSSIAQSNTLAEVNTNITALDVSAGVNVKYTVLLVSADGKVQPSITSHTHTYNFFQSQGSAAKCTLFGYIMDPICNLSTTAAVIVELKQKICTNGTTVHPFIVTIEADETGYFEQDLVESATDAVSYIFKLRYVDASGVTKTTTLGSAPIPNQTSVNLCDLV